MEGLGKKPIVAGPPVMSVREVFTQFAGGAFNPGGYPDGFGVVMPLTTTVVVEQPENVIGFAWRTLADENIHIITLPGRDWESTAAYTGMTKDLYEANIIQKIEDSAEFDGLLDNPLVAYASNILKKSLMAMDRLCRVIEIPRALSRTHFALLPNSIDSVKGLVDWLNTGVPLRKMKRQDAMKAYKLEWDDRSGVPVIGRNLEMDAKLFGKILDSEIGFEEPDEDGMDEDTANPF